MEIVWFKQENVMISIMIMILFLFLYSDTLQLCYAVLSRSVVSNSATSCTVACQAPLSMEFSRPEYWSGLPCPPPGDLPNPGIEPGTPALQAYSLLSESPGTIKNIGMGSLSLLQGIFPTQESNRDLPHCRQILYQPSYQGSPLQC